MKSDAPFRRSNRQRPCPVCGKHDWCLVGEAACLCARVESGDRRGGAGWLHRFHERKERPAVTPTRPPATTDWQKVAEGLSRAVRPDYRVFLARHLGLPDHGLDCYPLLGFGGDGSDRFFSFPEVNGRGEVVGVCRRFKSGKKVQMAGGGRGLSVPKAFDPRGCRVVFVVEGPTDVAAMWCAGLAAVGRPSNTGGVNDLAVLLEGCPDDCRIVVVGENDEKENRDWPGLTGAASVAGQVATILCRRPGSQRFPVTWALCPDGVKDVREWLTTRDGGWAERGQRLADRLLAAAVPAESPESVIRRLAAENMELRRRMEAVEAAMKALAEKTLVPEFRDRV